MAPPGGSVASTLDDGAGPAIEEAIPLTYAAVSTLPGDWGFWLLMAVLVASGLLVVAVAAAAGWWEVRCARLGRRRARREQERSRQARWAQIQYVRAQLGLK